MNIECDVCVDNCAQVLLFTHMLELDLHQSSTDPGGILPFMFLTISPCITGVFEGILRRFPAYVCIEKHNLSGRSHTHTHTHIYIYIYIYYK